MDTKKDIGQFFNDNLNHMDFTPNEDGWNKIEDELNEKKKKRRIFFWLFFGSFLSGCFLTLLLGYNTNLFEKNATNNKKQNNTETVVNSNKEENSKTSIDKLDENSIDENAETKHLHNFKENNVVSNQNDSKENILSNTSQQSLINKNSNYQINSKNTKRSNLNYSSNYKSSKAKRKNKSYSNQKSSALAFNKKSNQKQNNSIKSNLNNSNLENTSAANFEKSLDPKNGFKNDTTKIVLGELIVKDTTSLACSTKKPIKETQKLSEKDSTEVIAEKKSNSFILSPYYGYGLINKNQVTGNFKSTNNLNVSNEHYGFLLRWMGNKKLGVQIGLGYINASSKTEIEKTDSDNIKFNDVENNSTITFPTSNKLTMSHDLRLYEIPLEFYYKLNDKKIGFAFASGISHTIIKDNNVYIESTRVGRLQTITNQSFSANLKVYGIYKFSDKLQFELYPSFQYQFLNSLKNKDLNPYILSIRAGISYQF